MRMRGIELSYPRKVLNRLKIAHKHCFSNSYANSL